MAINYKILFNRNDRLRKDGRGPVIVEVYFDRVTRRHLKTGILLYPHQWDERNNHVKVTDSVLAGYRDKIDGIIKKIKYRESEKLMKGDALTPEDLEVIFSPPKASESFSSFFVSHLSGRMDIKPQSKRPFMNSISLLNKFKGGDVSFSDLTTEFIDGFTQFMYGEGLSVNTLRGHHKRIKGMISRAIIKDYISVNPYDKLNKIKPEPTVKPHLNLDELKAVEDCEVEDKKVVKVKDMFLFSCYCGLRFSDVQALCMDHIELTNDGYSIALHRMVKVPQPVFIPLYSLFNGKGEVILKKYIDIDPDRKKKVPIFPTISNQKCNDYLKLLAGYAKVNKPLSFHISRHTCASHLAYYSGDPFFIMQLLGWRKLDTSLAYIKGSHDIIKRQAEKIDWNKFNGNESDKRKTD